MNKKRSCIYTTRGTVKCHEGRACPLVREKIRYIDNDIPETPIVNILAPGPAPAPSGSLPITHVSAPGPGHAPAPSGYTGTISTPAPAPAPPKPISLMNQNSPTSKQNVDVTHTHAHILTPAPAPAPAPIQTNILYNKYTPAPAGRNNELQSIYSRLHSPAAGTSLQYNDISNHVGLGIDIDIKKPLNLFSINQNIANVVRENQQINVGRIGNNYNNSGNNNNVMLFMANNGIRGNGTYTPSGNNSAIYTPASSKPSPPPSGANNNSKYTYTPTPAPRHIQSHAHAPGAYDDDNEYEECVEEYSDYVIAPGPFYLHRPLPPVQTQISGQSQLRYPF